VADRKCEEGTMRDLSGKRTNQELGPLSVRYWPRCARAARSGSLETRIRPA